MGYFHQNQTIYITATDKSIFRATFVHFTQFRRVQNKSNVSDEERIHAKLHVLLV